LDGMGGNWYGFSLPGGYALLLRNIIIRYFFFI
jgi:hypothetical protein